MTITVTTRVLRAGGRPAAATALLLALAAPGLMTGCTSSKYRLAKKAAPPVEMLNIAVPEAPPPQCSLTALITYAGAGSWKREALWDEYVVTIKNPGAQPLVIDSASLSDRTELSYAPGTDPWVLEKQSKALEKQYRSSGVAFMRGAGSGAAIVGLGAAVGSATMSSAYVSAGAAGAAIATVVVLPVYWLSIVGINHHNKKAVMAEFTRRRLSLPAVLTPGETRTASLFFPMVRCPHALTLHSTLGGDQHDAVLPLDFLDSLHVPGDVETEDL